MNGAESDLPATGAIVEKRWDSQFFGFGVAEIADPDAGQPLLGLLLGRCREAGFRLVYWASRKGRVEDEAFLARFGGLLVDRKTTFARGVALPSGATTAAEDPGWSVEEEPPGPSSDRLRELAIDAGAFSRFRVDPGIPAGKFELLYETWIDRSTRREIADTVLVARDRKGIIGMVTVAKRIGVARIGLIAVDARARGRGVGRSLIAATDRWAGSTGAFRVAVVTQGSNEVACRLYRRTDFEIEDCQYFHHFWLRGGPA